MSLSKNLSKYGLLFILLQLSVCAAWSQDLLHSQQSGTNQYIYRIGNTLARHIVYDKPSSLPDSAFAHLVDSVALPKSYSFAHRPAGHYLQSEIQQNRVVSKLVTVPNCFATIIDNDGDFVLMLKDSSGRLVHDATVRIGCKHVLFDDTLGAYRLAKSNRKGKLLVSWRGVEQFYYLTPRKNSPYLKQVYGSVVTTIPGRFILKPIAYPFITMGNAIGGLYDFIRYDWRYLRYNHSHIPSLKSTFIYNKPKYKRNDTVKVKLILTTKKLRPVKKKLLVYMRGNNSLILIDTIRAYTRGLFSFSIPLAKYKQLRQDATSVIIIKKRKNKNIAYSEFKLEDYELNKVMFDVLAPDKAHYRNKPFEVQLSASDENNLPVYDAKYQLCVLRKRVDTIFAKQISIKDTLWQTVERNFDNTVFTKVTIPDSIFPAANLKYEIKAVFRTADNERVERTVECTFYHKHSEIVFTPYNDSLLVSYSENGRAKDTACEITYSTRELDSVVHIKAPQVIGIPARFGQVKAKCGDVTNSYSLYNTQSLVSWTVKRSTDSVHFLLNNPRKLPVSYFFFKANNLLEYDTDTCISIHKKSASPRFEYTMMLSYWWAGYLRTEKIPIPLEKYILAISVNQKSQIVPGQKVTFDCQVNDFKGRPVKDVDLTAWAFTNKFAFPKYDRLEYRLSGRYNRTNYNDYFEKDETAQELTNKLWPKLFKRGRLDSIEYYRYLYPDTAIYRSAYSVEGDDETQIAPFVFRNGESVPIHIIELNHVPLYYSWASDGVPYSFVCRNQRFNKLYLRTDSLLIYIDNLSLESGKKNIISIDIELCKDKRIRIVKPNTWKPYKLTTEEIQYSQNVTMETDSNNGHEIYLSQDNRVFSLQYGVRRIAPFFSMETQCIRDDSKYSFHFEPFYKCRFEQNAVKMFPTKKVSFKNDLRRFRRSQFFTDKAFTLNNLQRKPDSVFHPKLWNYSAYSNVFFMSARNAQNPELICFQSLKNPDSCVFYYYTTNSYSLTPDVYKAWIFNRDGFGYLIDSITVCYNAKTYISSQCKEKQAIPREILNKFYSLKNTLQTDGSEIISVPLTINCSDCFMVVGTVMDGKFGGPLPGATIKIKGTSTGTQTDFDGNFTIQSMQKSFVLEISFMGYQTKEILITQSRRLDITLKEKSSEIKEVAVVGYGVQKKSDITGSVSLKDEDSRPVLGVDQMMQGKVGGVQVKNNLGSPGGGNVVSVRGVGTVNDTEPLYVVDGEPMTSITHLLPGDIASIQVLKDAASCAKYGSRGANGVIVVTTKKGAASQGMGAINPFATTDIDLQSFSGERTNFKDDAFWQPRLLTDKNGRASFTVRFPDDITSWRTSYVAYKRSGFAGMWQGQIKAMKPLTAQLLVPRFLVAGDTSFCIGKTLNYLPEPQRVKQLLSIASVETQRDTVVQQVVIDSLQVVASSTNDSVKLRYTMQKDSNYTDGETRYIPIHPRGRIESHGQFWALRDTLWHGFRPEITKSALVIRAEVLPLNSMLKEIEHIHEYPYWCNEQMASKLIALLHEKRLNRHLQKPFTHDKEINTLIEKLEANKNDQRLWGWWGRSEYVYWISQHVISALLMARTEGYIVQLTSHDAASRLGWLLESDKTTRPIQTLIQLRQIDSAFNPEPYMKQAEAQSKTGIANYFSYLELLQVYKRKPKLDTMQYYVTHPAAFQTAYRGNWLGAYLPYYNNVQMNLTAYRLLRNSPDVSADSLRPMIDYFLNQRRNGYWNNTYESVEVLSTILPDLLKNNSRDTALSLQIKCGSSNRLITKFPFFDSIPVCDSLQLRKHGMSSVYCSVFQQVFNPNPVAEVKPFTVNTFLDNQSANRVRLQAGKPVELRVQVYMTYSAEYVMIDVPIPASCSYSSKPQPDTHREYNKDRTMIYCARLSEGMHTFTIPLIPRYSGSYTLNPARAELMYFPTEHGQTDSKRVEVK